MQIEKYSRKINLNLSDLFSNDPEKELNEFTVPNWYVMTQLMVKIILAGTATVDVDARLIALQYVWVYEDMAYSNEWTPR